MAQLGDLLKELSLDDVRVDPFGRVVITAPSLVEKLKQAGAISADDLARSDTNIICCGNTKCGGALDLGALVERFTKGDTLPG
jgi:hypothetical protein